MIIFFISWKMKKSLALQASVYIRLTNTELLRCFCYMEWQLHRSDLFLLQMKYGAHPSCQHLIENICG